MISWTTKMIIHYHLDVKHGRINGLPPADMLPARYFIPYVEPLKKNYSKEGKICNIIYWVAVFSTAIILICQSTEGWQ